MGAPYSFTFQRTEVKYRIPADRYEEFRKEMDPYIGLDAYGLSTICNIYYDTEDRKLITRSLAKPASKEKLRLRRYGIPKADSTVFPELKKKVEGVVYKRRCAMTLQEAEAFLNRREMPSENGQVQKELAYARDFYGLRPASIGLIAAALFLVVKIALLNVKAFAVSGSFADLFDLKAIILAVILYFAMKKISLHPVFFLAVSAVIGILLRFAGA